jgi:hypothetical protein
LQRFASRREFSKFADKLFQNDGARFGSIRKAAVGNRG